MKLNFSGKTYTCKKCGKSFNKHSDFIDHWLLCGSPEGDLKPEELTLQPLSFPRTSNPRAIERDWIQTTTKK